MSNEGLPKARLIDTTHWSLLWGGCLVAPAVVAFEPQAGVVFTALVALVAFTVGIFSPVIKYFLPDDVEFLEDDDE